jgi:cytohesin
MADDDGRSLRELVEGGLDVCAPIYEFGWTLLHSAAISLGADVGMEQRVRYLVEHGADPNARARTMYGDGWTPVHLAAWEGDDGMLKALLAAGGDPNARTSGGSTALSLAIEIGWASIVRILLAYGADPCLVVGRGETCRDLARRTVREREASLHDESGAVRPQAKRPLSNSREVLSILLAHQRKPEQ